MSEAPLVAGIELGGTKVNCILASGPDDIRAEVRIPTTTGAETMARVEEVLGGWSGFAAIGIASFGPIVIDRTAPGYGAVAATPKPGWRGTQVATRLQSRFGVPTGFNTDVVGAAFGEGRWGAAQGLDDFAYVTVGTGIGAGLIARGAPVEGMTHSEFGHLRPVRVRGDDWGGICPFHGDCVEGLAAGPAIAARVSRPAHDLGSDDPAWELVAHALAQMLHAMVMTGVPRRVVMGGGVMVGTPHLFPRIRTMLGESLAGYVETAELKDLDSFVVPAGLGDRAGPLGAIVLGQQALAA